MNVLCHGIPFCAVESPLSLYPGPHDVRSVGKDEDAQYGYDLVKETWNDVLARIRREWKPDLALIWLPELYPPPREIEDSHIPTVALVSDWNIFYPILAVNLSRYDLVLCDTPGVDVFTSDYVAPQHLFPLYSQVSSLHRPLAIPKDLDVAFAGNLNHAAHPARGRYLQRLAALSDRYRIFIARDILGEEYVELFNHARMVFNHSIRGELNLRVFETMACGSLALLEENNREVRDWFKDGREIVLYNEGNFEGRITYYLEHPGELEAIAARGHARVGALAAENRLTQLIDWAAAQPLNGRRFLELAAAEREFQDVLMYGYSSWEACQRIEERLLARTMQSLPDDPRVWTALGRHFLNPLNPVSRTPAGRERMLKAYLHAHRLDPHAGPRALNLASLYRMVGQEEQEAHYLQSALEADLLDGADLVMGSHLDPFWQRWQQAVATKTVDLGMLQAEAHIRLAAITARHGATELAEDHLRTADVLDAGNNNGVRLLADLQWAKGAHAEAARTLQQSLPRLSFDYGARGRLSGWLRELGEVDEADALDDETRRLRKACPFEAA